MSSLGPPPEYSEPPPLTTSQPIATNPQPTDAVALPVPPPSYSPHEVARVPFPDCVLVKRARLRGRQHDKCFEVFLEFTHEAAQEIQEEDLKTLREASHSPVNQITLPLPPGEQWPLLVVGRTRSNALNQLAQVWDSHSPRWDALTKMVFVRALNNVHIPDSAIGQPDRHGIAITHWKKHRSFVLCFHLAALYTRDRYMKSRHYKVSVREEYPTWNFSFDISDPPKRAIRAPLSVIEVEESTGSSSIADSSDKDPDSSSDDDEPIARRTKRRRILSELDDHTCHDEGVHGEGSDGKPSLKTTKLRLPESGLKISLKPELKVELEAFQSQFEQRLKEEIEAMNAALEEKQNTMDAMVVSCEKTCRNNTAILIESGLLKDDKTELAHCRKQLASQKERLEALEARSVDVNTISREEFDKVVADNQKLANDNQRLASDHQKLLSEHQKMISFYNNLSSLFSKN